MKVKDLIKELKKMDQDAKVILSKDAEGNDFKPLSDDFSTGKWTESRNFGGLLEESGKPNAVILWPED